MPDYKYLIIGGGMTADAATRGIREVDADGSIGLIGAEPHPPYDRPPLSKALWKGEPVDAIWRDTAARRVTLHLERRAASLELAERRVTDEQGESYGFEKLLLATGGTPRRLPFGGDDVIYYRTFDDYERLRALADDRRHFAVIGGGFIGSEIAAALTMNGREVTMLFPEAGVGARVFPAELAAAVTDEYRDRGVDVWTGETVAAIERGGDGLILRTQSGREVTVDGIVAGIGIQPNTALAEAAGLPVEDGIVVDDRLRAGHPAVFAAGDVANFHDAALGTRIRVEHEDNANTMGAHAGRAMAGDETPYDHQPFFYSDLFDYGYEAVGRLDSRLETVADWKDPFNEGVIYYLADGRVRGVLLWNVWGQVDAARAVIAETGPFRPDDLKGRIQG